MRRAGKQNAVLEAVTLSPTTGSAPRGLTARHEPATRTSSTVEKPMVDVLLSPAGTFSAAAPVDPASLLDRNRQLAIAIRQRIESRLPGRVRNLSVRILDRTVVLEGQCATYYTKQLAQHAALGILEDEQLENSIEVCVPR